MKKLPYTFYRNIIRQCRFLMQKIKNTADILTRQKYIIKLERKLSSVQKPFLFFVLSSIGGLANVAQAQNYDFGLAPSTYLFMSGSEFRPNFVDLDLDGDLDVFNFYNYVNFDNGDKTNYFYFQKNISGNEYPFYQTILSTNNDIANPFSLGGFDQIINTIENNNYRINFLKFKDFDGDFREDLFIACDSGTYIFKRNHIDDSIVYNVEPYFFYNFPENNFFGYYGNFCDINNDGLVDFFNVNDYLFNGDTYFFINSGTESQAIFDTTNAVLANFPIRPLEFIDIDKDGDLDFISGGSDNIYEFSQLKIENIGTPNTPLFANHIDTIFRLKNIFKDEQSNYNYIENSLPIDLDQDGDLDFVYWANYESCYICGYMHPLWWKRNTGTNFILNSKLEMPSTISSNNILLNIQPKNIYLNEIANEDFQISLPIGVNIIKPVLANGWIAEPPFITLVVDSGIDSVHYQNFVLHNTLKDYSVKMNGSRVRTGEGLYHKIQYTNTSDSAISIVIAWKPDNRLLAILSPLPTDSVINGVYFYHDILNPYETKTVTNTANAPISVGIGDTLYSTVTIYPALDDNPSNNFATVVQPIFTSYDPNDKLVSPLGIGENGLTSIEEEKFTYTIRFQNTGNDVAKFIVITDTINGNFDLSTFEIISSSAENYDYKIVNNVITFIFKDINLVEKSVDEALSQGFIKYALKVKENTPVGTKLTNIANIFFDFNPPITTNETVNQLAIISKVKNQPTPIITSKSYPNPAHDKLIIEWNKEIVEQAVMTVYDLNGKSILQQNVNNGFTILQLQNFQKGLYIYTIESPKGNGYGKFVVE